MGVIKKEINKKYLSQEINPIGFFLANFDKFLILIRTSSLWPMTFGLACCIENDINR